MEFLQQSADCSDFDAIPPYPGCEGPFDETQVYPIEPEDRHSLLFQTWSAVCWALPPFHGNACLHLKPLLAEALQPGARASGH